MIKNLCRAALAVLALCCVASAQTAPYGYLTVGGNNILDSTGAPEVNGTITWTPVNNSGTPINFRAGVGYGAVLNISVSGGALSGCSVSSVGAGYTVQPYISLAGAGTGGTVTATVSGGSIASCSASGGSGWTSAPTAKVIGYSQTILRPVSAQITNGAWTMTVADTSLTWPLNLCYQVVATDNVSGNILLSTGYTCVQPAGSGSAVTGTNAWCVANDPPHGGWCNFDAYAPNQAALVAVQTGPTGPANSLAVGMVSTLSAGSSATASITGTAPSQTLNLGIPTGATGAAGNATLSSGSSGQYAKLTSGTTMQGVSPSQVLSDIAALPLAGGTMTGAIQAAADANYSSLSTQLVDLNNIRNIAPHSMAEYGVVADGHVSGGNWVGTDNTTAIASAISAAASGGFPLIFPAGNILTQTIASQTGVVIFGQGLTATTIIRYPGSCLNLYTTTSNTQSHTTLENLTLDGDSAYSNACTTGDLVHLDTTGLSNDAGHVIRHVQLQNNYPSGGSAYCVWLSAGWGGDLFEDVDGSGCAERGWMIQGQDHGFKHIGAQHSGGAGIYATGTNMTFLDVGVNFSGSGTPSDGNGFYMTGTRNYLTGLDAQDNRQAGFQMNNCNQCGAIGLWTNGDGRDWYYNPSSYATLTPTFNGFHTGVPIDDQGLTLPGSEIMVIGGSNNYVSGSPAGFIDASAGNEITNSFDVYACGGANNIIDTSGTASLYGDFGFCTAQQLQTLRGNTIKVAGYTMGSLETHDELRTFSGYPEDSGTAQWSEEGTWQAGAYDSSIELDIVSFGGTTKCYAQTGNGSLTGSAYTSGAPNVRSAWCEGDVSSAVTGIALVAHGGSTSNTNTTFDVYIGWASYPAPFYDVRVGKGNSGSYAYGLWVPLSVSASNPGSGSQTVFVGTIRGTMPLASAAYYSIGTSAGTVPLMNGTNSWSQTNTFTGTLALNWTLAATGSIASQDNIYKFSPTMTTSTANQTNNMLLITPTYNQSSGSGEANTDLLINRTETSLGTSPGSQYLIQAQTGSVNKFTVDHSGNASVAGTLGVSGATTLANTTTGALTWSGGASGDSLSISGAVSAGSLTTTTTASIGTNATVGGTLGVTGAASLNGGLTVAGTQTINNSAGGVSETVNDTGSTSGSNGIEYFVPNAGTTHSYTGFTGCAGVSSVTNYDCVQLGVKYQSSGSSSSNYGYLGLVGGSQLLVYGNGNVSIPGPFTSFNSLSPVGNGVPVEIYNTKSTASSSSIGATTLATPGSNENYEIDFYASISAAGSGCTGTPTLQVNLISEDPSASATTTQSLVCSGPSTTGFSSTLNVTASGSYNGTAGQIITAQCHAFVLQKSSVALQYSTTWTNGSGCSTQPTYTITPILHAE